VNVKVRRWPSRLSHTINVQQQEMSSVYYIGPPIRQTPVTAVNARCKRAAYVQSSVSTGPGPVPGPLRSNTALVQSRNIFWTGLGPCVAFALLFLLISYKPQFTSTTKKESN